MRISTKEDKKMLLAAAQVGSPELANRLFYAARNLAIEAMLLRLEVLLLREGYPVRCRWQESSFHAPTVSFDTLKAKPSEDGDEVQGSCTLQLNRETVKAPGPLSACYYSVKCFSASEYYPRKQPAKLLAFRARLTELFESGRLAAEIATVNFPFDYESLSAF